MCPAGNQMRRWFGDLKEGISVGSAQAISCVKKKPTNPNPVSHNWQLLHNEKGLVGTDTDLPILNAAEIPLPKDIACVQSANPTPTVRCIRQYTSKYNLCWLQNCFLFFPLVLPLGQKAKNIFGENNSAATVSK